jgi:glycerophosphoryl diester phosphodiesterase
VHPYLTDTGAALVSREHRRGRRVHVWTVNEEADTENLLKMGVDGIFTDDPGKAKKILTRG